MNTLRALIYADVRSTINQCKEIRRSPARAIFWTLFGLFVAGFLVLRIVRAARHQRMPVNVFPPVFSTDLIVCASVILFGFMLGNRSRFAGLFAHPAEARFIIGSPAEPFVATLYIQLREIVRSGGRRGLSLLYFMLFYLPEGLNAAQLVRDVILLLAVLAAGFAAPLARQLLSKALVPVASVAGWCCVIAGALPLLRDAALGFALPPPAGTALLLLPPWHPGRLLSAGAGQQLAAIAILVACVAALALFVARAARDAYPELYELSMNRFARVERMRARAFGFSAAKTGGAPARTAGTVVSARADSAPGGVLIFVWRAWTEYRHVNDTRKTALETAFLLVAGYALARLAGVGELVWSFAGVSSMFLFLFALARAAALANELRRPLFWLSDATLFERLCGLALAHSWRSIAWFVLGAIGVAAGGAPLPAIVAVAVAGPCAALLAIAVGYASYGLLPHEIDQRGPLMFVRWMLGYVLAIPAVGASIALGVLTGEPYLSIAGGSVTALLESAVLIGFAAWRLDRMSILLR